MFLNIFKNFIIILITSTNYIFVHVLDNKVFYFTTAYVPAEHRQNTGYIFLSKIYKCLFLTNLHHHTSDNLNLHNLSLFYHTLV